MKTRKQIQDELLVLKAQAGAEGLDALVTRWQPALWRHAYRMTRDTGDAWDIVQEAWCAVVRRLDQLEDPAAFPRWSFQIVTNKCRDWSRKEARRKRATQAYEAEARLSRPVHQHSHGRLERALGELSVDLRQLVALYYEEELSIRDISEILEIKEGTVKSQLHRARQELRRYLEETDHGE